jgi:hypothetical protein
VVVAVGALQVRLSKRHPSSNQALVKVREMEPLGLQLFPDTDWLVKGAYLVDLALGKGAKALVVITTSMVATG